MAEIENFGSYVVQACRRHTITKMLPARSQHIAHMLRCLPVWGWWGGSMPLH